MADSPVTQLAVKTALVLAATLGLTETAFGNTVDRPSFRIAPEAKIAVLSREPGRTEIRVASNSAFTIVMSDTVGKVRTTLSDEMGANAQSPGPSTACTFADGFETAIYEAARRTAAEPGSPTSQSVHLVVHHSEHATPTFHTKAGDAEPALPRCG